MAYGLPARALAVTIVGLILGAGLAFLAPTARAGTAVVFIEDFESGAIGSRWNATDNDAASDLDYWGVSNYRPHAGNYSAWSAQVGTQFGTGQNNSVVHQYDDNMQADLVINLSVSGFSSLTLSFWYWSRAESGGGDYLEAWYVAGGVNTMIFQNRGSASWTALSLAVPNNVEQLIIRFTSDPANNNFEGAYVDDIVMTGTENNAPTSFADPLPQFVITQTVDVPFSATDGVNESGVDYVELWYRNGTTGNFTLYRRPANPSGQWIVSPARFDVTYATGDGYYELYTIAVDNATNREAPPAVSDASTTVDTTPPTISIISPTDNAWMRASAVNVTWQGSDALSGMDRYEVRLDGGPLAPVGLATSREFTGLADGPHAIDVIAFDRAGNSRAANVSVRVDVTPPAAQVTWPAAGQSFTVSTVTFTWEASDATSGIDHFEVWIDDGAHENTTDLEWTFANIPDGTHTFHLLVVDRAGNTREVTVAFSVSTFPWWIVILILAAITFLLILFIVRRKKRTEERASAPPPIDAPEEPPRSTAPLDATEPEDPDSPT